MRIFVGVIIAIVLLSTGMAVISVNEANQNINSSTRSLPTWHGTVTVHIKHFKCDPSLDTFGDPDPYFVVFINEKEIKSRVWDGEHDFYPDWSASYTLSSRDPVVWIEISAWDDDSGLYGRDDLIDIDPGDGFSIDLIYNLQTHTWAGDVTGDNASGNRAYDWGDIWFDITSTPDFTTSSTRGGNNLNVPFSTYGRIDSTPSIAAKSSTLGSHSYSFYVNKAETLNINMQPNPKGDFAMYLYGPHNNIVASAKNAGYGKLVKLSANIKTPGEYTLKVVAVHGYGSYYLSVNSKFTRNLDAQSIRIGMKEEVYILSRDWANINIRSMGYHMQFIVYNPEQTAGVVHLNFFNLDPDYVITNFENNTHRGKYSLTIDLHLNATEGVTVQVNPWYEPSNDFWVFAMGDNRPGCGIYDHPYNQGPQFTTFMYYYTNVVRAPIGWDDGDLVAGFGGSLVTEWHNMSLDALDYVYEMEYNRLYMLSGTHGAFFFTTVGNHDVSRHPDQPQHEGEHVYEEYLGNLYYSFNYSNTHFVFPDDYQDGLWHHGNWTFGHNQKPWWYGTDKVAHYGGYIYGKQKIWLADDLASATHYTHRIVVMHMPIMVPPGRKDNLDDGFNNYTNRVDVMKIFKHYDVDYLVVAHIHNYTYFYTNLQDENGQLNVTSSMSPQGEYSVFTLLTGGAGAHNAYEDWGVPAIEGSYHFVLIHVHGNSITYHVYKYENITDSSGTPLTTVSYEGANDGSETSQWGVVHNEARYNFPYIRMKFYMSPTHNDYVAYSKDMGQFQHVYQHKFKDYTVVYVETSAPANIDNNIHVYIQGVPEFPPLAIPLIIIFIALLALAFRKR